LNNNGYRTLVGHAHPCVWTSIDAIRKDKAAMLALSCSISVRRNDTAKAPSPRRVTLTIT